ncbi:MAG: gliding motility-associated C-terminal domain-containing protein [Elusimicrobia bacterium]|nr:gliding motility-associated C-terminal domain-containing protein [Elusimicrobiota bacterium]
MIPVLLGLLALWAPAPASAEPGLSGAGVAIRRNLIAGGGGSAAGAGLALDSAVAEAGISTLTCASAQVFPGLMHEISQPGSITSITAVSKDTGSLELSWPSPGRDGFQGDVLAGHWRIDASSDPAHVFAPTTYQTEFATTTAPGATQYYTLTGLLANTTYYTRIYLADARKFFAETSAPSDESTWSRLPASPLFSGVFGTSVTISWVLPADGAEGYLVKGSSTNFGLLTPGGVVVTSQTPSGLAVTLTVTGLAPDTTYYFSLGSLNWQSQGNFNTVMSTVTRRLVVLPIEGLAVATDDLGRRLTLTWSNPDFPERAGVTILLSTNPITSGPADGTAYPPGTVLADGAVVRSSASAASYLETGLTLDVTGYFSLYSRNVANVFSVAVSTFVVLDLPPMAPAGLAGALNAEGSSITLSWSQVGSNLDGSGFQVPAAPIPFELNRFEIYRATGIFRPNWEYVGSAPASAAVYVASVPTPGAVSYYKVVSRDGFPSGWTDSAMAVDTLGDIYALGADQVTRLRIPAAAAGFLQPSGNPSGKPLLVRVDERPEDLGGRVVQSVSFDPVSSPGNEAAPLPAASSPFDIALHYDTAGGQVVAGAPRPRSQAANPLAPAVSADEASDWLTAYYVEGKSAAKVFGRVDPLAQTVQVQAPYLGNYQIRATARAQGFSFDASGVSNRAITPDGNGLNDTVVFTFSNPQDSAVSGRIYDVRGRFVADLAPGPVAGASLVWDGKANGAVVPRGVYIYQIRAEGRTYNGTVVVIR